MSEAQNGRGPEALALGFFLAFTVLAILGFWNFGLNPGRLPAVDWAVRIYQISFPWFARAHILISAAVLFFVLTRHARFRWVPAMLAVYLLSFTSEHVGTGYGIPFSGYEYTGLLGARLLSRVPLVIPLSWFLMSAPAWILARHTFPESRQWLARILQATFLLVLWDLALDPAMSHLTPYWLWENTGAFYGMPWVNLVGWAATGLVLMLTLEALDRRLDWAGTLSWRWALAYYLIVLLMPLGMVTVAGLWWATAATLGALAVAWGIHRVFGPGPTRQESRRALSPTLAEGRS
ncbi:MAG: carotenoid biosynthesis protein [Gemmatimonadota bacterium]